jgi:hypothetical protein
MDFGWGWKAFWLVSVTLLIASIWYAKRHRDRPPPNS